MKEEQTTVEKVQHRLTVIKFKGVELLDSTFSAILIKRLAQSFRRLVKHLHSMLVRNDRCLHGLKNLFFRRLFNGFSHIRERANLVHEKKMINFREGFSALDAMFKNTLSPGNSTSDAAFSQIHSLRIELEIMTVTDVTNANKMMFSVKDLMNTSGNLSGLWEDTGRMSSQK